ncbi:DNA excision repair protein ERCC-1 [Monocercomonoides exilis]|uniref:DNA excision repair protein ERCC-1 n=1 Tax=Monocercomonoides exilis TaxID=2049356 RepID=UPI00355A1368|nr:DNA excision repair protein ERCC-1 [Monocercomonoides exilis]|eukprot:MONOS_16755.1-p1 / transcript=MONOS_16755.1 / gene=MONOS_16755 / organism=Monocercomonoides_exilis_PA203 / gene_product=DNA excision repair protein ERCC-1 / transcript_product=DNA excision repair protein ERCC-1 / location=Mono_scaffold00017:195081-195996(-) / protein_length=235 / sequence_SO=supercontig / SO=protein_coding / is_pseudo=false
MEEATIVPELFSLTLPFHPPKNTLFASLRQKGNPFLSYIKQCKIEYKPVIPDFIIGEHVCALFISLRFHLRNPRYLQQRVDELLHSSSKSSHASFPYRSRYLLCLIDTNDVNANNALKKLNILGVKENISLLLAWSNEQMANHVEKLVALQQRGIDVIMGKGSEGAFAKATDCLTTIPSITKHDAHRLLHAFGTLSNIFDSSKDFYSLLPMMGKTKVDRLYAACHEPFLPPSSK